MQKSHLRPAPRTEPPPDDVEALVEAVEVLVADPERRTRMGEAGRRWAEAWRSPDQVAVTYAELVAELGGAGA